MTDEQLMSVEFNLFFDEDGNLGPGGGLHLKVTNIGKFDEKTLADTLSTGFRAVKAVREVAGVSKMAEAQRQGLDEPLQDEQEATPPLGPRGDWETKGNRPRGGATEPQCKKILAICHRLGADIVIDAIKGYPSVEWHEDAEGHCLPEWDFLQSLDKFKASKIIERLERAEA